METKTESFEIVCRYETYSDRGEGRLDVRRVRLPNGNSGWATYVARETREIYGAGYKGVVGKVPAGTLVVEFSVGCDYAGMRPRRIIAGILKCCRYVDHSYGSIDWGLPYRETPKGSIEVRHPETDRWVEV